MSFRALGARHQIIGPQDDLVPAGALGQPWQSASMALKDDLELIESVVRLAATSTAKHHQVSMALQALERVARSLSRAGVSESFGSTSNEVEKPEPDATRSSSRR